ncbi:uncharacterized protein DUF2508 [Anaerobacterium chartisolvens]|uniref:Uncharacterized protein DUF2508 n=1 Tax=Anaerobacterium chartisolvens TaxID=1297424 RepID=A0A369B460_9FIRM|nr:YaaL family protein [Anaerobacterium chartisolvens]RCX16095.1 uncharacterized protein DUF2508 [Anaerobacterium chartisolvens]
MQPNPEKNYNVKLNKGGLFARILRKFSFKAPQAVPENVPNENEELLQSIRNAKMDWINANINFENADESELVDYYAYRIKACQVKYEYYIKKAKEKGIRIDSIDFKQQTFQ